MRKHIVLAAGAAFFGLVGCDDGGGASTEGTGDIELIGTWDTQFDDGTGNAYQETITSDQWQLADIVSFDNAENWAITQNPPDDAFAPDKFSRLTWIDPNSDGVWYYCTFAYELETLEDAEGAEDTSDDSDPETKGCGASPWTRMSPPE